MKEVKVHLVFGIMMKDKSFYAEATKGYIIKTAIDVLGSSIPRGFFELTQEGIFLRNCDEANTMLFDLALFRENFFKYKLTEPKTISMNMKHIQRLLRNVKKKDSVTLFIKEGDDRHLGITIRPERSVGKKVSRFETNYIVYQLEDKYVPMGLPEGGYDYSVNIDASDFQKIKRLTSDTKVGKIINVKMQRNNYLSFYCDAGDIYSSELGFGEINEDEDTNDTSSSPETGIYEAKFYSNMFTLLVKLPGLCSQMQFYSPKIQSFPLRIKMLAGALGHFQVYIKDIQQLAYEASIKVDNESQLLTPVKMKKKSRHEKY